MEIKVTIPREIGNIKICDTNLSSRIKNRCRWYGIVTVMDLLETDYTRMAKMRGMGAKSLDELLEFVHGLGYSMPNEKNPVDLAREEAECAGKTMLDVVGIPFSSCFYDAGIYTLEDLLQVGEAALTTYGIGQKRAELVRGKLNELGKTLKPIDSSDTPLLEETKADLLCIEKDLLVEQQALVQESRVLDAKLAACKEDKKGVQIG